VTEETAGAVPYTGLIIIRPRCDFDRDFARWFLLSDLFAKQVAVLQAGSAIQHFGPSHLGVMFCPVPSPTQQRAIARFLDEEVGAIDAAVSAKRRVLDLLAEKRKAIIATAVTRGLDPKVKLRDSGVPWLGEIPAHWEIRRSKYLFRQSALPVTTGDEIVTCFRDGQVTLRRNRREEGFTNADLEVGYQGIRRRQLVLHSMDAFAGAIGVSDSNGRCSPEYIICDPLDASVIVPEYFGPLLRTMALAGFIQASCPAVRERAPRIRFNDFGEMYLAVPPTVEQRAIVEHIARETAKLDAVRAATERTIALLKERRSALIAAAVTGQLDVGAAA
jgi:type I restriction enzyme S subunit